MKRLSLLTLVFAIASLVFFLLLIFFRKPAAFYPLMSYQDALDLLTPLVLIPLYWVLFRAASQQPATLSEEVVFMGLAAIWMLGHGLHLAANSINNLAESAAFRQTLDITRSDLYTLIYFYDEHLSHYLWHAGLVGLAALLIYREWRAPAGSPVVWWATGLAAVLYGFTYFCVFLEGQTVLLGLPFAVGAAAVALIGHRRQLAQRPVTAFLALACLLAALLFLGWGLYWGGFPEFSDVGLI